MNAHWVSAGWLSINWFEETAVVRLGARVADGAGDLTGDHIERRDQRLSAMPGIFELPAFDLARPRRQSRCVSLKRLDAGHLVH